jgi:hypothetical protein
MTRQDDCTTCTIGTRQPSTNVCVFWNLDGTGVPFDSSQALNCVVLGKLFQIETHHTLFEPISQLSRHEPTVRKRGSGLAF